MSSFGAHMTATPRPNRYVNKTIQLIPTYFCLKRYVFSLFHTLYLTVYFQLYGDLSQFTLLESFALKYRDMQLQQIHSLPSLVRLPVLH